MILERSEMERAIMTAVEGLPGKCREIFMLSKADGLKNKRLRKELGWLLQLFIFFG